MKMTSIKKIQFTSINDKRYYFSDGAISLPFSHLTLSSLWDFKKPYPKIHSHWKRKEKVVKVGESICWRNEKWKT